MEQGEKSPNQQSLWAEEGGKMTTREQNCIGPHGRIEVTNARDRFAARLFDELWSRYRERVSYVRTYEEVIARHGATFVNDHIAFRTFAAQDPLAGIASLSRIFEALGYQPAGCYQFPDKHLSAIHFQHAHPNFPKLFISELRVWELSDTSQETIATIINTHRPPIPLDALAQLSRLGGLDSSIPIDDVLLNRVLLEFHALPWIMPYQTEVEAVNRESQYAAWVLVHGYNVNHFTSLINSHGVADLDDIEKTIQALQAAGVPMKPDIEGEPGSKLRQSATAAVEIPVPVFVDGHETTMPWSYAYFELAERGNVTDPATGQTHRFEGFLGPQATQLFEMTRRS
jgi:2-oxoadipate dioxygenase/decarboxylase